MKTYAIATYYVDGKPACADARLNKGRRTAVGYFIDGRLVMSLPSKLNDGKIPSLEDAADMHRGDTVRAAANAFNRAFNRATNIANCVEFILRECLEWATPAGLKDGEYLIALPDGIHLVRESFDDPANPLFIALVSLKTWMKAYSVDLTKPAAPALQFAAPVFADNRANEQIMLDTLALIRHKRLALSTVYTVESNGVNMGSYLAESKPAALDACARAHGFASFANMETCLGRTLNFDVFAEFVNPLTSRVPS